MEGTMTPLQRRLFVPFEGEGRGEGFLSIGPKSHPLFPRTRGFTLLEVMIALAVMAVSLVVLLKLQSKTVEYFDESRSMSDTLVLAGSKIVETEAAGFPDVGKEEGDFGDAHPGFRWFREVADTGIDALRKVTVVVMPPGPDNGPGTVKLETLLARVEYTTVAALSQAAGGTGTQASSQPGQTGGAASLPFPFTRPGDATATKGPPGPPAAQNPATVFLPWLQPGYTASPPASPPPQNPTSLPWLTGGGAQGTQTNQ